MINNFNNKKSNNTEIQNAVNNLLGKKVEIGDDIKNLINSLSEEDINKISALMKNNDLQKIANSIIESKKQKG